MTNLPSTRSSDTAGTEPPPDTHNGRRRFGELDAGSADRLLAWLDLANFRYVNDAYGFDTGDVLLAAVAAQLRTAGLGALSTTMGGGRWLVHGRGVPTLRERQWQQIVAAVTPLVFDVEACARLAGYRDDAIRASYRPPPVFLYGHAAPALDPVKVDDLGRAEAIVAVTASSSDGQWTGEAATGAFDRHLREHCASSGLHPASQRLWLTTDRQWDPPQWMLDPNDFRWTVAVDAHQGSYALRLHVEAWPLPRGFGRVRFPT